MAAWRIPRWILPAAICGVLAMMAADLVLMRRHRVTVQPRAILETAGPMPAGPAPARPSPFKRERPEFVRTQMRPMPVLAAEEAASEPAAPEPPAGAQPPKESRFDRVLSKIPLLRRWQKHPPSAGTESSR